MALTHWANMTGHSRMDGSAIISEMSGRGRSQARGVVRDHGQAKLDAADLQHGTAPAANTLDAPDHETFS
jgi:hypothetical protein